MDPIIYKDIKRYKDVDFEEYKKFDGYSHSFLKNEYFGQSREIKDTDKMKLGRMVDTILTDHGDIDMASELYPISKSIAYEIQRAFGEYIKLFESQISYTATMEYQGHSLATTGRVDWELPKHAVIDLKVTAAKDVRALIKHMGYKNQLWNYAKQAQVKRNYIMIYSIPLDKTEMIDLGVPEPYNEFWATKILKFGKQYA